MVAEVRRHPRLSILLLGLAAVMGAALLLYAGEVTFTFKCEIQGDSGDVALTELYEQAGETAQKPLDIFPVKGEITLTTDVEVTLKLDEGEEAPEKIEGARLRGLVDVDGLRLTGASGPLSLPLVSEAEGEATYLLTGAEVTIRDGVEAAFLGPIVRRADSAQVTGSAELFLLGVEVPGDAETSCQVRSMAVSLDVDPETFRGSFEVYVYAVTPVVMESEPANFIAIIYGPPWETYQLEVTVEGHTTYGSCHAYDNIYISGLYDSDDGMVNMSILARDSTGATGYNSRSVPVLPWNLEVWAEKNEIAVGETTTAHALFTTDLDQTVSVDLEAIPGGWIDSGWGPGFAFASGTLGPYTLPGWVTIRATTYAPPPIDDFRHKDSMVKVVAAPQNQPPVAVASADKTLVGVGEDVQFSSAGSHDPEGGTLTYSWDFGDGWVSASPNPVHAYEAAGTYVVALVVTDDHGLQSEPATLTVTVIKKTKPPAAILEGPTFAFVGAAATFDGSKSFDADSVGEPPEIREYRWKVDDEPWGPWDAVTTFSRTFATSGVKKVYLEVKDNDGEVCYAPGEVSISIGQLLIEGPAKIQLDDNVVARGPYREDEPGRQDDDVFTATARVDVAGEKYAATAFVSELNEKLAFVSEETSSDRKTYTLRFSGAQLSDWPLDAMMAIGAIVPAGGYGGGAVTGSAFHQLTVVDTTLVKATDPQEKLEKVKLFNSSPHVGINEALLGVPDAEGCSPVTLFGYAECWASDSLSVFVDGVGAGPCDPAHIGLPAPRPLDGASDSPGQLVQWFQAEIAVDVGFALADLGGDILDVPLPEVRRRLDEMKLQRELTAHTANVLGNAGKASVVLETVLMEDAKGLIIDEVVDARRCVILVQIFEQIESQFRELASRHPEGSKARAALLEQADRMRSKAVQNQVEFSIHKDAITAWLKRTLTTASQKPSVPAQLEDIKPYQFKLRVRDAEAEGNSGQVAYSDGGTEKPLSVERFGYDVRTFLTKRYVTVPKIQPAAVAPPHLLVAHLGNRQLSVYPAAAGDFHAADYAFLEGVLIVQGDQPIDLFNGVFEEDYAAYPGRREHVDDRKYTILVGRDGNLGETVPVTVTSQNAYGAALAAPSQPGRAFAPVNQTVTCLQLETVETKAGYNYYRYVFPAEPSAGPLVGISYPYPQTGTPPADVNYADLNEQHVAVGGHIVASCDAGTNREPANALNLQIVNPTGPPVNTPAVAPLYNGNEFTYSSVSSGALIVPVRARIRLDTPEVRALLRDGVRIRISAIDDSHTSPIGGNVQLSWDHAFAGEVTAGSAAYNSENQLWSATATFTGLPPDNNDFGVKTVTIDALIGSRAVCTETRTWEVFFPRDATNHPGGEPNSPNWYHYWGDIAGRSDLAYGGAYISRFGLYDFDGSDGHLDRCVIYDTVTMANNPTGPHGAAGIDCYGQTVRHERKHREQFYQGFRDANGDGIPDYSRSLDWDGDLLSDSYEDAHGFNKYSVDTNGDGIRDPEEEAIQAESTWPNNSHDTQDWAAPGRNYGH